MKRAAIRARQTIVHAELAAELPCGCAIRLRDSSCALARLRAEEETPGSAIASAAGRLEFRASRSSAATR